MLVVAQQQHIVDIQDIMEAARRLGCEVRWLRPGEKAPRGSVAFFTEAGKGAWTQSAGRRVLVKPAFRGKTFAELMEQANKLNK